MTTPDSLITPVPQGAAAPGAGGSRLAAARTG
jgi:hypothetical protein